MTASVPSGFSRDDLEALLKKAPADQPQQDISSDESLFGPQKLTEDDLIEAASKICDDAMEVCADPLLHKAIALTICARMINWHNSVAEGQESEESRASWYRDAGKFQAILDILTAISLGPDDPFLSK